MRKTLFSLALGICAVLGASAQAQTCGGTYTVKRGESLSIIADSQYKNAGMWTVIHSGNLDQIGENPNNIRVGMKLRLRCVDGLPTGLAGGTEVAAASSQAAQPLQVAPGDASTRRKINVLTGSDFWPFTDQDMPKGGVLAEVVQAAMKAAAPEQGFAIHWVNDWASHQEPLLSNALLDMGFPVVQAGLRGGPGDLSL